MRVADWKMQEIVAFRESMVRNVRCRAMEKIDDRTGRPAAVAAVGAARQAGCRKLRSDSTWRARTARQRWRRTDARTGRERVGSWAGAHILMAGVEEGRGTGTYEESKGPTWDKQNERRQGRSPGRRIDGWNI